MVRKIPAGKKRTPVSDSFFEPLTKHASASGEAPGDRAVRLERQLILLRHEYTRVREENDRLKEAAALAPYGYCEVDRRGMILEVNEAAARMLTSDGIQLQGMAFVSFLPERFHQKYLSFLHHVFHTEISQSIDIPVMSAVGDESTIRLDCRSLQRAHGRIACCVMIGGPPSAGTGGEGRDEGQEEHFRTIADYSRDWKMWIGIDGALVWVNKGVELLTGYTAHECYSYPDFPYPLVADADRETVAEMIAEGLRGGEESGIEFRYRHKDGREVWGTLAYHPMYDASGQSLGFCATVTNIEQRKELEEELKCANRVLDSKVHEQTLLLQQKNNALHQEVISLTAALDDTARDRSYPASHGLVPGGVSGTAVTVPDGAAAFTQKKILKLSKQFFEQVINALGDLVLVKNKAHRYILVNNSFVEFTGIAREAIIGKRDHELFKADEADMFVASDNAVLEKQREFLIEELFTRHDGQQRRILVKKDIYFDESGSPFIVSVLRDVTEIRNVEDEVRSALAKEKELNELKSRFVTMVSHEYKTPLTAILSSAELLELFRKTWSEEKVNLHLQKIKRAVETMTEMLSDALFLNKIETSRMQVAPNTFELVSFCIMIADELQACTTQQNTIETSSSVTHALVCTDNKLLRYILTNMLSNAVKYSYPRTSIQFELVLTEQTLTFRVRNRGIGIPPENQDRLYEPFFRASNTGTIQGSGLGLSIAKRCVDALNGTIAFESIPGEVTTFTITLPIQVIEYQTGIARTVPRSLFAS